MPGTDYLTVLGGVASSKAWRIPPNPCVTAALLTPWCPKTRSRPFALINRVPAGVLSYGSAHVGTGLMASGCCACCA